MNIVQLNNFIEKIVSCTETVKSFYTNSVYECWNTEEVKYGSISFCITKTQMRERTMTYDAIIYYGDRLLEDKSNRNAIWSDATQVIQSIIGTVNSIDGEITISYPYNLTLFEQKFADELAGAYAEISIEVEGVGECGDLLYGYEDEEGIKLESVVKTFTINGEYDIVPSDGFDAISDVKVIVNIPIQSKSVEFNSNGSYNVTPDSEYAAMDNVVVNVNIPLQNKSVEFNSNGSYNVTPDSEYVAMDNVEVNVNIPLQEKSVVYSEVGDYQVTPDPGYEALSKVDVKVSLEGKTEIPNGFKFTGGDMSLVEWDKYDWSMVYDAAEFFKGCSSSDPNWFDRFKNGFNGKLLSGYYMFQNFNSNQQIDFTGINTSEMIDGRYMFGGSKFTNIKGLNALNMTDTTCMFQSCNFLESIDITNTHNVTSMLSMFSYCTSLQSISQLDTSKVTSMGEMFRECKSLESIPYLNTSNVTHMDNIFYRCEKLTTIPQLDTSKAVSMKGMFSYCKSLESIPHLNTSNVTSMSNIFEGCEKLTTIPQLDTSKAVSMDGMFYYCKSLQTIPQLVTSKAKYMQNMFQYCKSLTTVPELDISSAISITDMFSDCTSLVEVRFKGNPSKLGQYTVFSRVNTSGVLYYDSRYDYSKIISVLPSTWTSVPYDVID